MINLSKKSAGAKWNLTYAISVYRTSHEAGGTGDGKDERVFHRRITTVLGWTNGSGCRHGISDSGILLHNMSSHIRIHINILILLEDKRMLSWIFLLAPLCHPCPPFPRSRSLMSMSVSSVSPSVSP